MSKTVTAEKKETKARAPKRSSMFVQVLKRLATDKVAMLGLIILVLLIVISAAASIFAPYDPKTPDYANIYSKPTWKHPFGTDYLGRDYLSRVMYAGRSSLALGFVSALVGSAIGVFLGVIIGYEGGLTDTIGMRIIDIWAAIPGMLLAIIISTSMGSGFVNTVIAMTIGNIPGGVRTVRAMALKERNMEYLEAAKSINCSKLKIMFRHMMPNILSPTIVSTTMGIGRTIMGAAGLAFIGLGIQPPDAEWGAMLAGARDQMTQRPYLLIFPGLLIAVTVLSVNLLGDGLRDALDPRLKD